MKAHVEDIRAIIPLHPDVAARLRKVADEYDLTLDEWILENIAIAKSDNDEQITSNNNNKIWVDVTCWDCQIVAYRPNDQGNPMPNSDAGKVLFFNTCPNNRLNSRVMGFLQGRALRNAIAMINAHGGINISGEYGSLLCDEKDFIPVEMSRNDL